MIFLYLWKAVDRLIFGSSTKSHFYLPPSFSVSREKTSGSAPAGPWSSGCMVVFWPRETVPDQKREERWLGAHVPLAPSLPCCLGLAASLFHTTLKVFSPLSLHPATFIPLFPSLSWWLLPLLSSVFRLAKRPITTTHGFCCRFIKFSSKYLDWMCQKHPLTDTAAKSSTET